MTPYFTDDLSLIGPSFQNPVGGDTSLSNMSAPGGGGGGGHLV